MTPELRAAATVLVWRDSPAGPEVFMVRRHGRAAFMAGAHVFPGGAVDAGDRDTANAEWVDGVEHAAAQLPELEPAQALALHLAAARELFEEAGVLLARDPAGTFVRLDGDSAADFVRYRKDLHAGALTLRDIARQKHFRLAVDTLAGCAHWVTPPLDTRRFDTRFFAARLPSGQNPSHDERETTEGEWLTAAAALAAAVRREIILPPPTWVTLGELGRFQTVDDLLGWMRGRAVPRREPTAGERGGSRTLVMPPDPSYVSGHNRDSLETRFVWDGDRWLPESVS